MRAAAKHHEASLSWIAQQAWAIAREEIAQMPPSPSWAAKQRERVAPSQSSSKPQPAESQRPPAPPQSAPSQSSPDPKPQRQPARQPVALTPWDVGWPHGSHPTQGGEQLDHQARELYLWDNDGPTI